MRRRTLLGSALAVANARPLFAALRGGRWDGAAEVLEQTTAAKQAESAVLLVAQGGETFMRHFGKAGSGDAMFLLGSISKPISMTPVMTLFDRGAFQLDDRVRTFLPTFSGNGRDNVTIRHLLTHTSGLPDQLVNLRRADVTASARGATPSARARGGASRSGSSALTRISGYVP
jgi:CubicO group peptidase (beta-lactamase class C family)